MKSEFDRDAALRELHAFQGHLDVSKSIHERSRSVDLRHQPGWLSSERTINSSLPLVEKIALAVDQRLAKGLLETTTEGWPHEPKVAPLQRLIGAIQSMDREKAIFEPKGPRLDASSLHPWVWSHAAAYWDNGHRRAAIQEAAAAVLDVETPSKLRSQRRGKDVMSQGFRTEDPKVDAPRLRLPGYDKGVSEKDWNSAHEGAMYLGMGAAAYIRNLATHSPEEPSEQEGLEMLAVLSLVARLVDQARVEEVPTPGD